MISGVGTGGTITGVAEVIKARRPGFPGDRGGADGVAGDCAGVEGRGAEAGAAQDSGAGGAGFLPKNLNLKIVDEAVAITDDEAFDWARRLHKQEGVFGGISSGAAMAAAAKVAARPENKGKVIVTILPSIGERYLSTPLFEEE